MARRQRRSGYTSAKENAINLKGHTCSEYMVHQIADELSIVNVSEYTEKEIRATRLVQLRALDILYSLFHLADQHHPGRVISLKVHED